MAVPLIGVAILVAMLGILRPGSTGSSDAYARLPASADASGSGAPEATRVPARSGPDVAPSEDSASTPSPSPSTGTASPVPSSPPVVVGLPACRYADAKATDIEMDDWAATLIDSNWRLPATYEPPDLVPLEQAGLSGGRIRSLVVPDLRAMADAARADGIDLAVQSGYRSFGKQRQVYAAWVAASGEATAREVSARPGHSEHQLGTALDLRIVDGPAPWSGDFASTPAGRWLAANSWRYGFVISYPAGRSDVTCYAPEPWHVRYVGKATAQEVEESGLTLREWLWREAHP